MSFGCNSVGGGRDGSGETGWPTYAIDSDATRNRAMEWLSFSYDMQGELYYETTMAYFNGDAWVNQTAFGGSGDGTLFYPGTPAKIGGSTEIPVESIRLKGIRDGMEDYELLNLAKRLGLGAQALQIAQGVYPHTWQATTTPAALDSARAELAALILHALGKDVQPTPAPTPTPTPSDPGTGGATPCTTTACTTPDASPAASPDASPAATTPAPVTTSSLAGSGGGGCSSPGVQPAWLAILALAMFAFSRRRRRALAKVRR
jgi:MYXO-CTERM domain-containing protein